jgi:hypothetical protein
MTTATTATLKAAKINSPRFRRLKLILKLSAALILLLAAWVAYDLYSSTRTSMRDFDADEVARLDTAMWR